MKRIKGFTGKLRIGSLYVRWILLFMVLISFSYFATTLFISRQVMPEMVGYFKDHLERKAEFVLMMAENEMEITEDIFQTTGDTNIRLILFDGESLDRLGEYKNEISVGMLGQAERGEILLIDSRRNFMFCLFKVDDWYALLMPNPSGTELEIIGNAMGQILRISTFIGAVLIVIALLIIIRPIKKVITATGEVSRGNFDIEIPEKHRGDVGQLIKNFNKMVKSLQKNEYLKKDFVSSVSHEFKTPITSIEGFARLLRDENLSKEDINDYTEIIIKESERLSHLSSNLLKLSELDGSVIEPEKNTFYLDEQIRNIILLLESYWSEKNITFDVDMNEITLYENEELLHHVWFNIIHNAIKFSYYGSVISISANDREDFAEVLIRDNGQGMTPEQTERIFERFFQADKSHSGEGSGLGMSIVKRIIDILNGQIICESKRGEGTAFIVKLKKS